MRCLLAWLASAVAALLLSAAPLLDKLFSLSDWLVWGYVCAFIFVVAVLAWAKQNAPDQPEEPQSKAPEVTSLAEHRERHHRKARGAQGPMP